MMAPERSHPTYIVTGPTSGIGLATTLLLARQGTIILVGRNQARLDILRERIAGTGGKSIAILCDLSDIASARRAAREIVALDMPIHGLVNNAGTMPMQVQTTTAGWDMTFTTNHLGPFALTDALLPHFASGTHVVFVASAIEDPDRKPAKVMGMRGGRFISVEASARGEWLAGGCRLPGVDAYATSKQCSLASALALAREHPRLRINAVEPGINPTTSLGGGNALMRFVFGHIVTRLPPFRRYRSTPERAAFTISGVLNDPSNRTGIYFDEKGAPMTGSSLVHERAFQDRVVNETRQFIARHIE